MTQRHMLEIAKKYNIENEDQIYNACDFVLEMVKELHDEMKHGTSTLECSDNIIKNYEIGSWVVGDVMDEIELIELKRNKED